MTGICSFFLHRCDFSQGPLLKRSCEKWPLVSKVYMYRDRDWLYLCMYRALENV